MAGNHTERNGSGYYLNIESYYDRIHRTTWARRTAGMLAGGTLGAVYGAVVGAVAAFVPYVLHAIGVPGAEAVAAAPTWGAIGSSAALFSAVTAGTGMLMTADVAATSASSAVGMEEKEKREKLEELRTKPAAEVCTDCAVESAIVKQELRAEDSGKKGPPMFSWKVAAIGAAVFAAFGALIGLNSYTAAPVFNSAFQGLAPGVSTASVTGSAAAFGMFGTLLGMKNSLLTNRLTNFYYNVVTERIFNKSRPEPHQEPVASKTVTVSVPEVSVSEPARGGKSFAAGKNRFSLENILERKEPPAQDTVVLR